MKAKTHPFLELPFIKDIKKSEVKEKGQLRNFWSVSPTGDYTEDCITGAEYALTFLECLKTNPDKYNVPLQWIIFDMPKDRAEGRSGIEVGFLSVLSEALLSGAYAHERLRRVQDTSVCKMRALMIKEAA